MYGSFFSSTYSTPWRPSATGQFNSIVQGTDKTGWDVELFRKSDDLPKLGANSRQTSDQVGHQVLASATHWLTAEALDGRGGGKLKPRAKDRRRILEPLLSARDPPSNKLPQVRTSSGSMTAREVAPSRLLAGGQISCVGWTDFGGTDEERRWILKQIETKAGQKFKTVREAFRFVDADRDGHVDLEEMRYFFRAYDIPSFVADRFFNYLDEEKRGEIDYDFFVDYFKPYVVRGVHGFHGVVPKPEKAAPSTGEGSVCSDTAEEINEHLSPDLRSELRLLMQDIGRKLPLKFKAPRDAFRALDLERNGRITRIEMRGFFRGFGYNEKVADRVFELLAEDETRDVSFPAFMIHFDQVVGPQFRQAKRTPLVPVEDHCHQNTVDKVSRAIQERMTTKYKNVQTAFRDLDLNKDGSVDRHEMKVFLKKLGYEKCSDTFFDALDEDKSGEITYDEFVLLCGEEDRKNPSGAGQFRR